MFRLRSSIAQLRLRKLSMATPTAGPIESAIRDKLTTQFSPMLLHIRNDSAQHRHHSAMREQGGGAETHFSVKIVSSAFRSKTTIQRHRLIHAALKEELDAGLHSLSLQTKTEQEEEALEIV